MSAVRCFEPHHMFLFYLVGFTIEGSYLGLLNSAYSIDLGHLGGPDMSQDFLLFHFFEVMDHYYFPEGFAG